MNAQESPSQPTIPWYKHLNRYHWFVFFVAVLGWMFDTMDQQLFTLARMPAMQELLDVDPSDPKAASIVTEYGGFATSIFLIGWATGGLAFGVLGDRWGRAKTMMLTILLYSIFTGLSAFSVGFWDFALYRFLTGLGVGGEFAVGVTLVAEVIPHVARPYALALLQALSAVGNISAAIISMVLGEMERTGAVGSSWRIMFLVGTLPALLVLVIRRRLKEPEKWQQATTRESQDRLGSYRELFGHPVWRRRAIVGMLMAFSGVVGLWGIGFFSYDLTRMVLRETFQTQGLSETEIAGKLAFWAGVTSIVLNVGGFFGIYAYGVISESIGRRPAFAIAYVLAAATTALVFLRLQTFSQIFWMVPLMGFCQLMLFGGFAVYFPELFPTRLRSTGVSFCYNVGRFVAASGPTLLGQLTSHVFVDYPQPMRYAGVTMCLVFVIGLMVLPFAPETRGEVLPE